MKEGESIYNIILNLHEDKPTNSFLLDINDVYKYITENTSLEIELALYISKWCEYLNLRVVGNQELMFGDTDKARLVNWIAGYDFAKKNKVKHFSDRVEIKMRKYHITLYKPYKVM